MAKCYEIPININDNSIYDLERYSNKVKDRYMNRYINSKEVFITFDDGPSANSTMEILNILKTKNVKATFFLVGNRITQYPQITKRLAESNMCLAPHTYSHQYKIIYKSVDSYFEDLKRCRGAIKTITGKEPVKYVRFPGGSDNEMTSRKNLREIREKLLEQDTKYVDWNVSSGDAIGPKIQKEVIEKNIINQSKNSKLVVVLMHDSDMKKTTVEALPLIIDYFTNNGYEFKTFEKVTPKEENIMKKIGVLNRAS
jgi:peptidoglycan/xylan/chitin deacetylase (PgdA/CDA1 family)